jgi:phosphohistidine phosphatase
MAKRLLDKKIEIDAFVSSPAKRAKKTAEMFCEEFGEKKDAIIFIPELYHANTNVFFKVAEHLSDDFKSVAIFSHNPGITEFINLLVENIYLDNMPTCGVFAITIHTKKWSEFKEAKKELLFFDYPKNE